MGEQRQIARILGELLGVITARDSATVELAARLSELESATLAKAFRGELVPQDPKDEPAADMLSRLRIEAAAESSPQRRSKAAE